MKTICPHCSKEYEVPEDYLHQQVTCTECQQNFVALKVKFCLNCGTANSPLATYCINCKCRLLDISQNNFDSRRRFNLVNLLLIIGIISLTTGFILPVLFPAPITLKAQLKLARKYLGNGESGDNYTKAVYWLKNAERKGSTEAQYLLGYCYIGGYGVPPSPNKALEWLTKAAEGNPEKAQQIMSHLSENGVGIK